MTITTFQPGQTYSTRFICDHDSILSITIAKRSKCFLTTTEGKRVKIHQEDGVEYCYPTGIYSMAPIVRADKPAEAVSPIQSEICKVTPYFVRCKFADVNKNQDIEDYVRQVKSGLYCEQRVKIGYEVKLSLTEWNGFCTSLLESRPYMAGKGGEECILVSCGWQSIVVDPQGYDYARYVGLDVQRERHLKAVA